MTENPGNKEIELEKHSRFFQEKEQFRPLLEQVIRNDDHFNTVEGLAIFANNLQHELHLTSSATKGDFGRVIFNAGTELAARVTPTLIDRSDVDLDYEKGNLSEWLRTKKLDVKLEGPRRLTFTPGENTNKQNREEDSWFSEEDFTPGGLVLAYEYLAVKMTEYAALSRDLDDKKVFRLASVMASVVSEEIRSIALTGKPIEALTTEAMLKTPFSEVGFAITQR
jgi:hypothetical protein